MNLIYNMTTGGNLFKFISETKPVILPIIFFLKMNG